MGWLGEKMLGSPPRLEWGCRAQLSCLVCMRSGILQHTRVYGQCAALAAQMSAAQHDQMRWRPAPSELMAYRNEDVARVGVDHVQGVAHPQGVQYPATQVPSA